jgi:hypothetical protein
MDTVRSTARRATDSHVAVSGSAESSPTSGIDPSNGDGQQREDQVSGAAELKMWVNKSKNEQEQPNDFQT